jgi:PEP-CTERM motif
MTNTRFFAAMAAIVLVVIQVSAHAQKRGSRIDSGYAICPVSPSALANNGSQLLNLTAYPSLIATPISCAADYDYTQPVAYGLNFYGTTYNSLYANENGSLTFGAGLSATATSDLLTIGLPTLAPFLTDFDNQAGNLEVRYGWETNATENAFYVTYSYRESALSPVLTSFEVAFTDITASGDFDLEFDYYQVLWDGNGATAGVSNGNGLGYVFSGAGTPGAYFGDPTLVTCEIGSNPLPCNTFGVPAGAVDEFGLPVIGPHIFRFRNGVPISLNATDVPEPMTNAMLLFGLAAIGFIRNRK